MTENANLKRRIRARAAKTGESYTAARRHLLSAGDTSPRRIVIRRSRRSRQTRETATNCTSAGCGSER